MAKNNNTGNNNDRISFFDDINPRYNVVPTDLNSSPLQDYFEQQAAISINGTNNNGTTAAVKAQDSGKTMPVLIPPGISENTHDKKKRHHKRRRKPIAQTLPDDSLEAVLQRRQNIQPPSAAVPGVQSNTNSNKIKKGSQFFIVGSLQEKPPVPWPTSLTTPPDKLRRLANRNTVNWPLLPENYGSGAYGRSDHRNIDGNEEEEDDIFGMDNDFYNSTEYDEDELSDM